MAVINNQAEFNGLLQSGEARYNDGTETTLAASTVDIVANPGHYFSTPALRSTSVPSGDDRASFTLANGILNLRDNDIEEGNWITGHMQVTDGVIYHTGNGTFSYPGFQAPSNATRYTLNWRNSQLRSNAAPSAGGTASVAWQFVAIADDPALNDFTGIEVINGVLVPPYGYNDFINVTFSSDNIVDSSVGGTNNRSRFRFNHQANATNGDTGTNPAAWDGLFNCDYRNWADVTTGVTDGIADVSFNVSTTSGPIYFIDGQYSADRIANGLIVVNGRPTGGSPRLAIAGQSWNPRFVDEVALTEVEDLVVDVGARGVTFMQATTNRTERPAEQLNGGSANNFVALNGRNGLLLETDREEMVVSETNRVRLTIADNGTAVGQNIPYWSFTHSCYDNRTVRRINSQRAEFEAGMQLSDASIHRILLASDAAFLNGRTATQAEGLRTGGISNLDDAFAVTKVYGTNNNQASFPIVVEGTALNFGAVNVELVGDNSNDTIYSNVAINLAILDVDAGPNPLAGGTIFNEIRTTGTLSSTENTQLENLTFTVNTANLNNITFGPDVVMNGGTINNSDLDATDLTINGNVTFGARPSASALDWTLVDIPAGATLTIPDGANQISISGVTSDEQSRISGNNLLFIQDAVSTTVNIATPTGGYYLVDRSSQSAPVRSTTRFEAGDTIPAIPFSSATTAAGETIRIFIKYDSDISTRTVYQEAVTSFAFDNTQDVTVNITAPQPVAATLVEGMATTFTEATVSAAPDGTIQTNRGTIVTIDAASNTALTLNPTQGLALATLIGNQQDYFTTWALTARNGDTDPILEYQQAEVVRFDISRITFASADTVTSGGNTFRIQHVIRNWQGGGGTGRSDNSNAFALARTGAPEVLPQVEGTALLSTVIAAVDGSATATRVQTIETTTTATETRAERIHNGVGYLVGSGNDSRLVGIKPRSAAYVSGSTTDEGNL